jgi:hypothetical protein
VPEVALAFGLTLSGQSAEVLDYDVSATRSGDWSIVIFNDINLNLAAEQELVRLSRRGDIVVVHVDVAPDQPSFITGLCSPCGPIWTGLQTRSV